MRFFGARPDTHTGPGVTRRDCLRYFIWGWGLMLPLPLSPARAAETTSGPSLLEKYLGEELSYQIGYWLLDHVGDAKTGFMKTDISGIYKLSLEGHGVGFINLLLGGIKYSYTSFCRFVSKQDRLQPVYFELKRQRGTTVSTRSISYNYSAGEITFLQNNPAVEIRTQKEPLRMDRIYEDYLTLFYNFRHGYYGSLKQDRTYRMPLYTKKKMNSVKLHIADLDSEKKLRSREPNQTDKDFLVSFQINPEDVSSDTGDITGWLSSEATPVKGVIRDVVFFGDLWGDLIKKQILRPQQQVSVPAAIKDIL